jgi:hypothetical protein
VVVVLVPEHAALSELHDVAGGLLLGLVIGRRAHEVADNLGARRRLGGAAVVDGQQFAAVQRLVDDDVGVGVEDPGVLVLPAGPRELVHTD